MTTIHSRGVMGRDDERFDRLADGELSPDEYRALIAALDAEPALWRQCALAFLEAQALGQELGHLRQLLDQPPQVAKPQPVASHTARHTAWSATTSTLAIVASFVAALTLGIFAPRFFAERRQDSARSGNSFAETANNALADSAATLPHHALRPVGNVRLVMDGSDGEAMQAGQVPVYDAGVDLAEYLSRENAALGPEIVELLRQYGYDVRHQTQFVPAPLDDGRQIIVPLDGYQITPVSRRY